MSNKSAFEAIQSGDMGRFMMAMARGVDVNTPDSSGRTLLLAACEHDQDRHGFVQQLLESKALVTLVGPGRQTPIHALANKRALNIGTLEMLIDAGAALNEKNTSGQTALHAFAERGWTEGCTALLNASPRPMDLINVQDHRGRTPLWYASDQGALACILVSYGADPRIADVDGKSPAQMVTDVQARALVLLQVKALIMAEAAQVSAANQDDPELADIMSQSKAILAKGFLRTAQAEASKKSPQP
jgi:ankyrin repeat protein